MNNKAEKLKQLELMILRDVKQICDENNLKYYLVAGTLIGAIRHGGFIPWDDDIDIGMFREDYDKLFDILKKDYSQKYFVQRFETDCNYTRYIMKVRLNGTKHLERVNERIDMNQGIYIDVFPIDYITDDLEELKHRGKKLRRLFALKNIKHKSVFQTNIKKICGFLLRGITVFISDEWIDKQFKKVCEIDNESPKEYVTIFPSHYEWKKQRFPASYYGDGTDVVFEGEKFKAPTEYHKILTGLFGDYMKLPDEKDRVHHNIIEVDFGKYDI